MKRANAPLFCQFFRVSTRGREIENKNLKSAQQPPNGLVIERRSLFAKVRPESVHKRAHGVIGRAGAIDPVHESHGIQISCPRQDILISLAIGTGRATGEGKESQQNEIHLPGLLTERMGEAGRAFRLLRLL